ncbi:hypothetical protein Tco_1086201, partial [Tanacetum coccineum]
FPPSLLKGCKTLQNISLHGNPISMDQFQQLEKLKLDLRRAPITVSAFPRRGQSVIFRSGINNKSTKVVVSQHANNRRVQLLGVRCAFVYDSETFKKIWSDDPDDLSIQVTIPSNLNVVLVSPYSKLMICHDAVKESHDISRSKTASISLKKDHREILKMLTRVHGMDFGLGYLCESRSIQVFQLLDLSSNSCYPATMPSSPLETTRVLSFTLCIRNMHRLRPQTTSDA